MRIITARELIEESERRQRRNWRAHLRRWELMREYGETVNPEVDEFGILLPGFPTFEEWLKNRKKGAKR